MANTTAELTWLTFILQDLHISPSSPPILYCDNLNALHMTVNPVFHARSKHIELDYHFVREHVALGLLITQHISTHEQIADIFTKPMSKGALAYFKDKLCLRLRPSLREDVNGNKTDAHGNNSTVDVSQQHGNQHGNESALMETNQLQQ
jgi:hypothetical protein